MELIRTGLRDKLPSGLSYPVGAELISTALAKVPQFDELWISFNRSGGTRIEDSRGAHKDKTYMRVFSALLSFNIGSSYLSVSAVSSDQRHMVRRALVDYGLPEVSDWLTKSRQHTWFEGTRSYEVGIATGAGELCFIETHNDKVVSFKTVVCSNEATG